MKELLILKYVIILASKKIMVLPMVKCVFQINFIYVLFIQGMGRIRRKVGRGERVKGSTGKIAM